MRTRKDYCANACRVSRSRNSRSRFCGWTGAWNAMSQEAEPSAGQEGVIDLEEPKKMTREDWRKKKELEEQRKLGNAPAEVDEEGKYGTSSHGSSRAQPTASRS